MIAALFATVLAATSAGPQADLTILFLGDNGGELYPCG